MFIVLVADVSIFAGVAATGEGAESWGMMGINLSAEQIKPVSPGAQNLGAVHQFVTHIV